MDNLFPVFCNHTRTEIVLDYMLQHNHCGARPLDKFGTGLGSIPFFQFNSNSNSMIFNSNSNSNSTAHNKFQFQFQFQRFQFQFQFQFRRFQIQPQLQKWPVEVFHEIDYNYNSKVYVVVYKIIVIKTISLISLVKWLWIHGIMADVIPVA